MGTCRGRSAPRRRKVVHDLMKKIKRFGTLEELSMSAAKEISELIINMVEAKGSFTLALSGGNTPRTLYRLLASRYRTSIPWDSVQVFFCDERYVPHDDQQSNYRMVKETLLDSVHISPENIYPVPTNSPDAADAAQEYEGTLREHLPDRGKIFDLVLLGMGGEGHTASLFPGSPALEEKRRWVAAVDVKAAPSRRITLTYPILNAASDIFLLVAGKEKATALTEALSQTSDLRQCPAAGILSSTGDTTWWVDSEALPV